MSKKKVHDQLEARLFSSGEVVEIHGLQAKPELNGQRCRLRAFLPADGRWTADVEGRAEPVKIKEANLRRLGPESWRLKPLGEPFQEYLGELDTDAAFDGE